MGLYSSKRKGSIAVCSISKSRAGIPRPPLSGRAVAKATSTRCEQQQQQQQHQRQPPKQSERAAKQSASSTEAVSQRETTSAPSFGASNDNAVEDYAFSVCLCTIVGTSSIRESLRSNFREVVAASGASSSKRTSVSPSERALLRGMRSPSSGRTSVWLRPHVAGLGWAVLRQNEPSKQLPQGACSQVSPREQIEQPWHQSCLSLRVMAVRKP